MEEFFRSSKLTSLLALSLIAGGLTGLVLSYQLSFTSFAADVDGLADKKPIEITKVYAVDGTQIGELALERRIPLEYNQIPERLKQAILAIEDTRFYDHMGIDPVRLVGAAIQNISTQSRSQGASTLTQQLARVIFLSREKTYIRKIKEIMYALQIERVYTKEQIMTLYCNQIFLGGGAYGFEAAANYFFSRPLKGLELNQYALLAALPKAPQQYSPLIRPERAKERRNLVLQAMADVGYITKKEADAEKAKPLGLNPDDKRGKTDRSPYAYFLEEVRQELQRILVEIPGKDPMDVYKEGLRVYTTLDHNAQNLAVEAVRRGARSYERRHGWKIKFDNVIVSEGASLDSYRHPSWISAAPATGDTLTGLINEVNDRGTKVSFGAFSAVITAEKTQVLGRPPSKLFKRGDLAQFKVEDVDFNNKILQVRFEPEPEVQSALILLNSKTGEIISMVGGYDFATSKFNHATQAYRQTGSAFKPFIYAAALEQGLRPDDIVDDSPFRKGTYEPHNYDEGFMGPMSIRTALALSRNIPAVRVLDEIGVRNAADLVDRMKLPKPMAPFLASALGATEEPLLDMVSAYSIFPNRGLRIEPFRIKKVVDRDGRVLSEAQPATNKVLHEYVAAQMVELLRGPVQSGTARAAISQGHPLAGKTGTVNDFTDAWFIGFTPDVVCGVWIGYSDQKRPLGRGESGSSVALPIWNDFMSVYLKSKPKGKFPGIPELPDQMRQIQANRARIHAAELARIAARSGDILPGSSDLPNLDPLAGSNSSSEAPTPASNRVPQQPAQEPAPAFKIEQKPLRPTPESKLQKLEEPVRKGKKGKVEDP
ncbi:MAG: PBP1A family penicillin-binding protein [Acidobacteria bacterium]|nr:PBP1A family penicillin-binding protein [Acidobacteriota bacterium]